MKEIKLSLDEIKVLVSFLANANSNALRFSLMAKNMGEAFMQVMLEKEKKIIDGILEKLLKK